MHWSKSLRAGTRRALGTGLVLGKYIEARDLCEKYVLGREDSHGAHLPMAELLRMTGTWYAHCSHDTPHLELAISG